LSLPEGKRPMDDPAGIEPSGYISKILPLFLERLDQQRGIRFLDLGPILGANIAFFSRRVPRLFVCDLFSRLNRAREQNRPPEDAWRTLDYPQAHFDGILMWDLLDHLDTDQARALAAVIQGWTRPRGLVMLLSRDLHSPQGPFVAFAVQEDFQLEPRAISFPHLPVHRRQNREILDLMPAFSSLKSFIYRNGIREHLFRLEAEGI